jgi:hypothetical protein
MANIDSRKNLGTPLADNNTAGCNELTIMALYPKPFRFAIPAVAGTTNTLFMGKKLDV